jgi:hypothetical protein
LESLAPKSYCHGRYIQQYGYRLYEYSSETAADSDSVGFMQSVKSIKILEDPEYSQQMENTITLSTLFLEQKSMA